MNSAVRAVISSIIFLLIGRILVEKFRLLFGRLLYAVVKILNFINVEKISKILLKMVQVRRKTNQLLKCRDEAKLETLFAKPITMRVFR